MKGSDRLFIGIIGGIVLLVVVAVVLTVTRPPAEYQPEDTPAGVVYNYLLALQNEDYERAYSYLSRSLRCYPSSVSEFTSELRTGSYELGSIQSKSWAVEQRTSTGVRATVSVSETGFRSGGLFESGQTFTEFEVGLQRPAQDWRIVDAGRYFPIRLWTAAGCK